TMTKVIKEEFEKLESVKISDVSLTCNTSLEIFNEEFNWMSIMEDGVFTYEVEIAEVTNISCDLKMEDDSEQQISHESDDDMEYDPSDVEFTEWLASKIFNYKTMDHYTMKALWIYWARGNDEVELTDEESSNSDDEDEIYEWNKDVPWVHERPWMENGVWKEPTTVKHHSYIIGNTLRYQDLEWYEALKDGELKKEALKNKSIMDGMINEDDESSNEGWKKWDDFDNTNSDNEESENEIEHEDEERSEVSDDHKRPVCYIRRFEMVKYSFRDDKEYVAIKENECDDLTNTSEKVIHTYQEIFYMMDEGWMVTRIK
ncbi:hypothetical protein Tco_0869065, partial [Tanacetum coccineum]